MQRASRSLLFWLIPVVVLVAFLTRYSQFGFWGSFTAGMVLVVGFRIGLAMIRGLAVPPPATPPPGSLRKVKINYVCLVCGAEVRMTQAAEEDPEPPRHCMEPMEPQKVIE